jgi:SRSO17 transposase
MGERIGRSVVRQEARERIRVYLRVFLSPVERKNGWQVAEESGEATPYALQHLLDRAKWDADGVRDELRSYVSETLGEEAAVLVIAETGGSRRKAASRWGCSGNTAAARGG